jgi:hypothetical protein
MRTIDAFYFGTEHRPGRIPVSTFWYNINNGYDIPLFSLVFANPTLVESNVAGKKSWQGSFAIFINCQDHSSHPQDSGHYEFLAFRYSKNLLLPVYPHDEQAVGQAICW